MNSRLGWLIFLSLPCLNGAADGHLYGADDPVNERDLYCSGCVAVVDVMEKAMVKKSFDGTESRVYGVLENICDRQNFLTYDYIPPKMVAQCKKLIDELDEEAYVNFLVAHYKSSRPNRRIVERATCLKLSNACVGSEVMDSRHDKEKEKERIERQEKIDIEDKHFPNNVDDLMRTHGHKIKQPTPVKTEL